LPVWPELDSSEALRLRCVDVQHGAVEAWLSPAVIALTTGFVNRNFTIHYAGHPDLVLVTYAEPGANGRWEQFLVMPE